jgi:hypothetical protein
MKNLTENQQEIIDLITNEFVLINEKKATESDDIFAYIDSAVNQKKLYAEEMKQRNALYESVIVEKCDDIEDRIFNIVHRYGYRLEHYYTAHTLYDLIRYTEFKIWFENNTYHAIKIRTNVSVKENIESYDNTDVMIRDGFDDNKQIQDANLEKYIADLIIKVLKREIK